MYVSSRYKHAKMQYKAKVGSVANDTDAMRWLVSSYRFVIICIPFWTSGEKKKRRRCEELSETSTVLLTVLLLISIWQDTNGKEARDSIDSIELRDADHAGCVTLYALGFFPEPTYREGRSLLFAWREKLVLFLPRENGNLSLWYTVRVFAFFFFSVCWFSCKLPRALSHTQIERQRLISLFSLHIAIRVINLTR